MVTMSAQLDRLRGSTRPAYALRRDWRQLQTRGWPTTPAFPFVLDAAIQEVSQKHPLNAKRTMARDGAALAPVFAGVYNLPMTLQPFSRFGFERALSAERL